MNHELPQVSKLVQEVTGLDEAIRLISGSRGMHTLTPFTYGMADFPTRGIKNKSIPPLRFTDGPKGINLGHSTCFPVPVARGASWDVELENRIGQVMAIEAAAQGANSIGSVCVNLIRHPSWGRAQESYSSDPVHTGAMGVALMKGIQSRGVMAILKHFACNSIENTRFRVSVEIDRRTLHEIYLPHFKQIIDAGVAGVMSAYNKVNGEYCGHNSYLLKEVLKKRWGFKGFVMSDFMFGIRGTNALAQGIDLEMPQKIWFSGFMIKRAIKKGILTEAEVVNAANRVLKQLRRFHFSSERVHPEYSKAEIACPEHINLALESAQKSCVLLKNEDKVLPFRGIDTNSDKYSQKNQRTPKIAVIGRLAKLANMGSTGSVKVYPPSVSTLLDGLKQSYPEAEIRYHDGRNQLSLNKLVMDSDFVVVAAGMFGREEGEYFPLITGGDRLRLELPDDQIRTIKTVANGNPRHVVVLYGGSAIACGDWLFDVKGLLFAGYPGMRGGQAIAQIISGEINPSGHLPLSFPKRTEDLPPFDNKSRTVIYDMYHDYRWFEHKGITPAFSFGHGLSYTEFAYSDLKIEKKDDQVKGRLSFQIENTGESEGATVAQVYISKPYPIGIDHPVFELKTFARVYLKKGEKKRIELDLAAKDFASFNPDHDCWHIEKGQYQIHIGESLDDLKLKGACEFNMSHVFENL